MLARSSFNTDLRIKSVIPEFFHHDEVNHLQECSVKRQIMNSALSVNV